MGGCTVVVGVDGTSGASAAAQAWATRRAALEAGQVLLRRVDGGSELEDGAPSVGALRGAVDLVVVATPPHRHLGWRHSVCSQLLTQADVPLVVVPERVRVQDGPVVVGVSEADSTPAAIRLAVREARLRDVPLVAAHVWGGSDALGYGVFDPLEDELAALLLLDRVVGAVVPHLPGTAADVSLLPLHGSPAERLRACSEKAQLVVVGRGKHRHYRRGVGEALVRSGPSCPVVVAA